MHFTAALFAAILAVGQLAAAQEPAAQSKVPAQSNANVAVVPDCKVVASDEQADLQPAEPGVLLEIKAHEGQQVDAKELLVQLDARKARSELAVAKAKLAAAEAKANDNINVRYAGAAAQVARAEYDVSVEANRDVPGTVPAVRLNELKLKVQETKLSIEKATLDHMVAVEEAKVPAAEAKAAEVLIERHEIHSPFDGVVQEVRAHVGEYVQPTKAILRVVRLDSLWVEGSVSAAQFTGNAIKGRPVTVEVALAGGNKATFHGTIIFVKDQIQAGNKFSVRAKVENRKENGSWLLTPGMTAAMAIELK